MEHREEAIRHLEQAGEEGDAWVHVGIAGVHAVLHLAKSIEHGLRDIIYEMRS